MKTRVLVTVGCCLLGLVGCSTLKVPFQGSPLVPAAKATATIEMDQNENALVDLVLEHLAPAENLWPPKALYMVWVEESEGRLLPLGRLHVNEERQGRFRGTTPFEHFRIIISAEDEPNPERPSLPYVLATEFMTP
jgi:hypothetical protein